jgi:predicted adenylyl cyclase CyaB
MDGELRENLEIKARVRDAKRTRESVEQKVGEPPQRLHQIDTYFCCDTGRLKLREITYLSSDTSESQLIWYQRSDTVETKSSHYRIASVADADGLKQTLDAAFGIDVSVIKRRDVFFHENVRIHLDKVEGIGNFLELEAVQQAGMDRGSQLNLVDTLCEEFHVAASDRLRGSYRELVLDER